MVGPNPSADIPKFIDEALAECKRYIDEQRWRAFMILLAALVFGLMIAGVVGFSLFGNLFMTEGPDPRAALTSASFVLVAAFTVVFGVLIAIYRFHLNEISKTEHYRIGFMRIRIAANNSTAGFDSEVRDALTEGAFTPPSAGWGLGKKKVESPIPGHPGSDVATALLNKILEGVEVRKKGSK